LISRQLLRSGSTFQPTRCAIKLPFNRSPPLHPLDQVGMPLAFLPRLLLDLVDLVM
jgi:hypothetical protein